MFKRQFSENFLIPYKSLMKQKIETGLYRDTIEGLFFPVHADTPVLFTHGSMVICMSFNCCAL